MKLAVISQEEMQSLAGYETELRLTNAIRNGKLPGSICIGNALVWNATDVADLLAAKFNERGPEWPLVKAEELLPDYID